MIHRAFPNQRRYSPGFTRVEALALIVAILVLVSLQVPSHGDARRVSRASVCLAGMRQLQLGWTLYAADHEGRVVSGGEGANTPPSGPDWSAAVYLDYSSSPQNYDPARFPGRSPLRPYAGSDPLTYRCPSDPGRVRARLPGMTQFAPVPRTRSRSLNCWVGGPAWVASAPWRYATSVDQLADPGPANTFTFVDEREDSINDGTLLIDMTGFEGPNHQPANPQQTRIIDYPAYWHRGGAAVAFADGHVGVRKWRDERTTPRPRSGILIPLNVASPRNPDVTWLQEHSPRLAP
ncbi:MAG: hypothetical protein JNL97_14245 [Verrucomicrobiales bacterium]|nr:hypothetical protein [Verrucomicrobiales bacterium]